MCFYEYNNYYYLVRESDISQIQEEMEDVTQVISQEDSFQKQLMNIKEKIKPIKLLVIAFPR